MVTSGGLTIRTWITANHPDAEKRRPTGSDSHPLSRTPATISHADRPRREVDAIATATDPRYRAMVWIGAVLGMRWSEVAGLRVSAIDFLARAVTIADGGTVIRDQKGRPQISDPKSAASAATLPIPLQLVEILAEHLAAMGLTAADGDRLIFETPEGGPLRYANWRNRTWLPAVKEAGCEGAGFHDLRRANATALVRDGVDIRTAQSILRHSDSRLTLNLYAHLEAEAQRAATNQTASRFLRPRDGREMEKTIKRFLTGFPQSPPGPLNGPLGPTRRVGLPALAQDALNASHRLANPSGASQGTLRVSRPLRGSQTLPFTAAGATPRPRPRLTVAGRVEDAPPGRGDGNGGARRRSAAWHPPRRGLPPRLRRNPRPSATVRHQRALGGRRGRDLAAVQDRKSVTGGSRPISSASVQGMVRPDAWPPARW